MSALILNLNDTIAMSDSLILELAKVMNTCQPCIQETETSCNDVRIVAIICATIVLVALIVKWAVWSWQKAVITSKEKNLKDKEENEKTECKRKQKADLRDKLLTFLEKNTSAGDYYKDKDKIVNTRKDICMDECQYYINVLKSLISDKDIPNYPQDSKIDENEKS